VNRVSLRAGFSFRPCLTSGNILPRPALALGHPLFTSGLAEALSVPDELALPRFLRHRLLGFRYWLPSLPDQVFQGLSKWKLAGDGLDNVLQFVFATSKGTLPFAHRNGEIERVIADRVPWKTLFHKRIFFGRQNKKEIANSLSHYSDEGKKIRSTICWLARDFCLILDNFEIYTGGTLPRGRDREAERLRANGEGVERLRLNQADRWAYA